MLDWNRRVEIAQAAVDRFCGYPVAMGERDCVRLAAFVLRAAGYPVSLVKAGSYSTLRGARRALTRAGFATLAEAVDAQGLTRIAPAARWPADIIAMPAEADDPFGCSLAVALTNGRILGLHHETGGFALGQPTEFLTAWRL